MAPAHFKQLRIACKMLIVSRTNISSSMGTSGANCHPRTRKVHRKSSHGSSSTAFGNQKGHKLSLFYIYMSARSSEDEGAAVVDPGACALVVGHKMLYQTMPQLKITHLKDAKIIKDGHCFGTATTVHKSDTTVIVPFVYQFAHGSNFTEFHIRFDLVKGSLPFLIGLPCLLAIKPTLNFCYLSVSLKIKKGLCRIEFLEHEFHHCLPLRGKCNHQHPPIGNKPTFHRYTCWQSVFNCIISYYTP